jgi:hypothetical protein
MDLIQSSHSIFLNLSDSIADLRIILKYHHLLNESCWHQYHMWANLATSSIVLSLHNNSNMTDSRLLRCLHEIYDIEGKTFQKPIIGYI